MEKESMLEICKEKYKGNPTVKCAYDTEGEAGVLDSSTITEGNIFKVKGKFVNGESVVLVYSFLSKENYAEIINKEEKPKTNNDMKKQKKIKVIQGSVENQYYIRTYFEKKGAKVGFYACFNESLYYYNNNGKVATYRDFDPKTMKLLKYPYTKESKSALDIQVGGNHYKDMVIQPTEYCQKNKLNYCESNVIKYVSRHKNKNGVEDINKAIHYLELLKQLEY